MEGTGRAEDGGRRKVSMCESGLRVSFFYTSRAEQLVVALRLYISVFKNI